MRITLHQDVEGRKSGETVDVEEKRAEWYLQNGYASAPSYKDDEHPEMGVLAKHDPMLAENVKDEPLPDLRESMANGLGNQTEDDPDEVVPTIFTSNKTPAELTNGKGNPEKAAAGKEKLEKRLAGTDPADAVESDPELVAQREKDAAAAEGKAAKAAEAALAAEGKETGVEAATVTTDAASDPAQKAATKARGSKVTS